MDKKHAYRRPLLELNKLAEALVRPGQQGALLGPVTVPHHLTLSMVFKHFDTPEAHLKPPDHPGSQGSSYAPVYP